MEIVKKFQSNFAVLTVCKGVEGKPNFYSISQLTKTGQGWKYIPFLRKSDNNDLFEVIRQYKVWEDAGEHLL